MNIKRVIRQIEKEGREAEVIRILALSLQNRYEVQYQVARDYLPFFNAIDAIIRFSKDDMGDSEKIKNIKNVLKEMQACS